MNFLNVFEQRVGGLFGATAQGLTAPFSFKKLAKKAAREMEAETFVIDGVDTAPALFTILVSSEDDLAMRPLYAQLTHETSQFIEGQAQNKGYVFVGKPVVRFMADPSLRSGRFSVFAENVDARTLNRLREEEAKFMGANPAFEGGLDGAAAPQPLTMRAPQAQPQPSQMPSGPMRVSSMASGSMEMGLDVLPQESVFDAEEVVRASAAQQYQPPVAPSVPNVPAFESEPAFPSSPDPVVAAVEAAEKAAAAPAAAPVAAIPASAAPQPISVAAKQAASVAQAPAQAVAATQQPQAVPVQAQPAAPTPTPQPQATCLLIDRQSGRTYTASAPRAVIGRERTPGGIVLRDPNVSRTHAELTFTGSEWRVRDLNSTNGTLVNDVDVDECVLRDGDFITLGLITLEFREN